jgi:hypothetical protein
MIRNVRWFAATAVVAVMMLATGSAQAQVKPFKITGGGIAPLGLPLPGEELGRQHLSVGTATHLGKYTGDGNVATDSAVLNPDTGKIEGEFGSGTPYVFTAANGDKLVCVYGRTTGEHPAAEPGTFELTIIEPTAGGLVVTAAFVAEFVVQPESCTGRFEGVTGSWIMYAFTEPFLLGSSEPIAYTWHGEGELTFPDVIRRVNPSHSSAGLIQPGVMVE